MAVDRENFLLLTNVELQNVGGSPINFQSGASLPAHPSDGPLKLYVQRVMPLPIADGPYGAREEPPVPPPDDDPRQ